MSTFVSLLNHLMPTWNNLKKNFEYMLNIQLKKEHKKRNSRKNRKKKIKNRFETRKLEIENSFPISRNDSFTQEEEEEKNLLLFNEFNYLKRTVGEEYLDRVNKSIFISTQNDLSKQKKTQSQPIDSESKSLRSNLRRSSSQPLLLENKQITTQVKKKN